MPWHAYCFFSKHGLKCFIQRWFKIQQQFAMTVTEKRRLERTILERGGASNVIVNFTLHFPSKQNLRDGGVAGGGATGPLQESQKGQSKLVPWCLKGGGGNKTHSHPPILSKWKTNKKNMDQKLKGEVKATDRGGNKMYWNWPKERNLKYSTEIFSPTEITQEPADGVVFLKTHNHRSRSLYRLSQLTDCSQLRENITGAPNSFWLPVTWILRNLYSHQDLGGISDLTNNNVMFQLFRVEMHAFVSRW